MKKRRKIIFVIIIIILIIIAVIYFTNKWKKNSYTSVSDFKSVKEVVRYLDCEYLSESSTKTETEIYLKFKYLPYDNGTSYEKFYNQLMGMVANVLEFKNFVLVDNSKNIRVDVTCDGTKITDYNINGSKTYFADMEKNSVVENFKPEETTNTSDICNILNNCIKNDWNYNEIDFGTQESTFLEYNVFFDEGIEVKEIKGKIFNIVFTDKFSKPVLNNLNVGSDFTNVINTLGTPTYGSIESNIIGYKTNDFYLFFHNDQNNIYNNSISIYRVEKYDTTEFAKLVDTFLDNKNSSDLINNLINNWKDFDSYYDDLKGTKSLRYTLKGIEIKFNVDNEHGVTLYNDFNGNITPDLSIGQVINKEQPLPQYIYVKNTSLVYINEQSRLFSTVYDDVVDSGSDNFVSLPNVQLDDGSFSLLIVSKDGKYPNSEVNKYVNSKLWLDNDNLAYGVAGEGIYIYNAPTRQTKTIITGNLNYIISKYENKKIYYDNTSINIDL